MPRLRYGGALGSLGASTWAAAMMQPSLPALASPGLRLDSGFEDELRVVDITLATIDGNWPEGLARLGSLLARFAAPADRVAHWAAWTLAAPSDVTEAAISLARATQREMPGLVEQAPIVQQQGVREVLKFAASLRPNALLQSLFETLDRCSEIDVRSAFEERVFVAATYDSLIDHPFGLSRKLEHLDLLRNEGVRRVSPWLLLTAIKVGAALMHTNSLAMAMENAATMRKLASVYLMLGRFDEALKYVNASLDILAMMFNVDSEATKEPMALGRALAGIICERSTSGPLASLTQA